MNTFSDGVSIELRIDALVLEGFAAGSRYEIGEAVHRELERLFGERGLPARFGASSNRPWLAGGSFECTPDDPPEIIGRQIAAALFEGFEG